MSKFLNTITKRSNSHISVGVFIEATQSSNPKASLNEALPPIVKLSPSVFHQTSAMELTPFYKNL